MPPRPPRHDAFNEGANHGRGGVGEPVAITDVPHPRGGVGFREMAPERQSAAHEHMAEMHAEARPRMAAALGEKIDKIKSNPRGVTPAKQSELEALHGAAEELHSLPKDPMEASVQRVTDTAMAPVNAVREHREKTGEMLPVSAGEFYGARHDIGRGMTEHYFGGDEDKRLRGELATPEWSARTTPQQEVTGASGMLAVLRQGRHVDVSVGPELADLFNTHPKAGGWKGGAGGETPIEPGKFKLDELARRHPQAAAIMMQHHARASGLVTPVEEENYEPDRLKVVQNRNEILQRHGSIDLPEQLEAPTQAMVASMGQVGFPKAARSMSRFYEDPENFGGGQAHKIPSYTWNIHGHDETMAKGTHHFLGVMAHGEDWLHAHPEAHDALTAASKHPAWNDPTSTMDVWSGKVASGFPLHTTGMLGKEKTNPEKLMTGGGIPNRSGGERYGSPADMGYFWGEEAHRQASQNLSINVPGIGRMNAPAHVTQSLSWYGVQAEENAHQVAAGNRTLTPKGMQDPESLNSLQFPQVYGRRSRAK